MSRLLNGALIGITVFVVALGAWGMSGVSLFQDGVVQDEDRGAMEESPRRGPPGGQPAPAAAPAKKTPAMAEPGTTDCREGLSLGLVRIGCDKVASAPAQPSRTGPERQEDHDRETEEDEDDEPREGRKRGKGWKGR